MRRMGVSVIFFAGLFWACTTGTGPKQQELDYLLKEGIWRGVLKPQGIEMPFLFNVKRGPAGYSLEVANADERIVWDEVIIKEDSLHVQLAIFDATISAKIIGDKLSGSWVKNYAEDYVVPFEAAFGNNHRFEIKSQNHSTSFDGKWEVDFIGEDGVEKAIGLFSQVEQKVTGTFLTTTGDYRYLEGVVEGNSMKMSCFDGCYAYLFEGEILENGEISGDLWSGKTRHNRWTAKRNDDFELPDPYAMTFMQDGFENFEFSFPNTSGKMVNLSDEKYKGKIVIVQLLGTWCPNCMDETLFYVDWLKKNTGRAVEVIGLAFEAKPGVAYATTRIDKMKKRLGIEYEVLIAGTIAPESKAEALPMLNKIMAFPTSIILDKQHKVRKIHTGFSGPGTGDYYENFIEEFNMLIDKMIEE